MDLIGPIVDMIGLIGPSICNCLKYHIKLKEYLENLERSQAELQSRIEDIQLRIANESRYGKTTKNEVENWVKTAKQIIAEAKHVEEKARKVKWFSRCCLGKLADKKTQEIKEEYGKSNFESLVVDAPSSGREELRAPKLVGERDVKERIWRCLMEDDDQVGKIGVCGMGGIGKTTIMMHIYNDLLKETKFGRVIWITVSQAFNVGKLQNDIASRLNERLDDDDAIMRAGKLSKMLERQGTCVIILDDVWESFGLEQVGIPEPTPQNGCKLVLTSRREEVARSMGFQIIRVKPLSHEESLKLFSSKVGDGAIMKTPTLAPTVKLVVKECAGLPLAIVVVGSSMRGISDPSLWKNALNELRQQVKRSLQQVEDEVFGRLEFSYNRLKHEKDRHCFLYCALYPEDHDIYREELIEHWIEEGLIDEMESREAMRCSGRAILQRLEENCLLIEVDDFFIKMHDVVRDMALHMTRKRFFVKAGLQLKEVPEWNIEDVEKVSLMTNSISEIHLTIPSSMQSPRCQHLTTLLLSENRLRTIPEAFFDDMPNLKILDLSRNPIQALPKSLSNLESLTALLLSGCEDLKAMPCLSKLQALKKLNLWKSGMEEVPQGLEMLINLRYLILGYCYEIPRGTISKLYRLQHLVMFSTLQGGAEEIRELNKLEVLLGVWSKVSELNNFASFGKRLINFSICITEEGSGYEWLRALGSGDFQDRKEVSFSEFKIEDGDVIRLPSDVEEIYVLSREWWESLEWDHPNAKNVLQCFLRFYV
ncbi:Disease resistance protein [Corchorus capsularis]|uniref:Disease resistance protein n=1 Tax=Corchorus capsularis TaxID=210143 RepID=A0A1R3GBZ0_COCAP|nr:Disease resistance protein [Corchorus capsularis]